ncbi:MAG: RNA polymerase sigma factor [Ignavibacteriaceae bacterium]
MNKQPVVEEEIHLVKESQNGNSAAFEKLYHLNVKRVYALCIRITSKSDIAEELTQDVFVRAWDNIKSFRGESLFSTWLHRLAVNVVLVHLRTQKRRLARFQSLSEIFSLRKKVEAPTARGVDIEKAIEALPNKAKIIFLLHDVEGYKHTEIAEMMKLSPGTTKAQLHRARKLLRKALER